nr:Wzz/FepE/Etk N-terminal domain-containing protein [Enterovibrio paralichthyis]
MSDTNERSLPRYEIDVRAVVQALRDAKKLILFFSMFGLLLGYFYTSKIKDYWTASAIVVEANTSDLKQLNQLVKYYQILLAMKSTDNENANDASKQDAIDLNFFLNDDYLYDFFISMLESDKNKSEFSGRNLGNSSEISTLKVIRKDEGKSIVSIRSEDRNNIHDTLNNYISYTQESAYREVLKELDAIISIEKDILNKRLTLQKLLAEEMLRTEIEKSKLALKIALEAGIVKPLESFYGSDNLGVEFGVDVLNAKISALKNFKHMEVINSEISGIKLKKSLLELPIANEGIENIVSIPKMATTSEVNGNSKRFFVLFTGVFLGLIFGIVLALFRKIFL